MKILEDFFKQVAPEKILASDYEYLARFQVKTGRDTMSAIKNFYKAIEMDSSKWALHLEMADLLYSKKDYCGAAVEYQKHIDSLSSPTALQYYRLGLCHYFCPDDTLRYHKAEVVFGKVTELAPSSGLGWSWRAKAMSKLEPDIVNHPELLEEFGKAKPFFDKYVEITEPDTGNLTKNKRDLITAYEYLASYYFLRKEDALAKTYLDKLVALDPENESAKNIKLFMEGQTPAPPGKGGGKGK